MASIKKLVLVSGILLLVSLACGRFAASASTKPALQSGENTRVLNFGGLNRSYVLYLPSSANLKQPLPLVFAFHGGMGNAESIIQTSGFNQLAEREGFLVVYPNGTSLLSKERDLTWNGGACCGYASDMNIDDVAFVRAIVADLQPVVNIDKKRIYATGMSNGGLFAQRLGCEAADLFAAIAPVSGTLNFSPCTPSQPISVLEFHGTADENIPYSGGVGPRSVVRVNFASVRASIDFWVTSNGCNPQPATESDRTIRHESWPGCKDATAVELYTIIDGGHTWPGDDALSASETIWDFFSAHSRP
jgi:polyhydroxybutyrate depolymerase